MKQRFTGYSMRGRSAYRLLNNTEIRVQIEARVGEIAIQSNQVLKLLSEHAAGSMAEFITINDQGQAKTDLSQAIDRGKMHLVKKFVQRGIGPDGPLLPPVYRLGRSERK